MAIFPARRRPVILPKADRYPGAMLALDFVGTAGSGPAYKLNGLRTRSVFNIPGWTYTGGTPAGTGSYAAKADGSLQFFPSYTNLAIQSYAFDNASWTKSNSAVSANAIAAPDGTTTADKLNETAVTNTFLVQQNATVSASQVYTASVYAQQAERRYVQISYDNNSGVGGYANFDLQTGTLTQSGTIGGGTLIGTSVTNAGGGWWRVQVSAVASSSTTGRIAIFTIPTGTTSWAGFSAGTAGSGIYIWGAQLELGSTASTYIPTTTAAVTVATPRITDAGYWAEEARTNSIRNNSMVGAVAGTPGTAPTNWSVSANGNGLSVQLVGTGTDSVTNASYADYRFFGTTTNGNGVQIKFDTATGIAATNGQAWTISAYTALIAGSFSGFTSGPLLQFDMNTSGAAYAGNSTNTAAATLATLSRSSLAFTTNQATTAYVQPYVVTTPGTGKTVDFTLRVSLPQMELGSVATSPIPTTSVAVNRAVDVGYVSGLVVPSAYTMLETHVAPGSAVNVLPIAELNDAVNLNNRVILAQNGVTGIYGGGTTGGGGLVGTSVTVPTTGNLSSAIAVSGTTSTVSAAASSPVTTPSSVPTSTSLIRLYLGNRQDATRAFGAPIRRIVIYPRAFGNSELQAATIGPVSFANDNPAPDDMKAALWGWVA